MAEDWDFYFARVDDAVASIFLDLGLRDEAPIDKRPWLLWVRVQMQSPRPDGLSSNEEARKLGEIEEALDALIAPTCGAQLVGRVTGSNRRDFYFYASEPGELDDSVARAMKDFESYRYETGSSFQPDWDQYLNFLHPSPSNRRRMLNRRVLEALAAEGDVHEVPRQVDHWLYFDSAGQRDACRDTLTAIEFALVGESEVDDAEDDHRLSLQVSRVDSVDSHTINGITIELERLAGEHGGRYDGWECPVTQGEPPPN